MKKTLFTPSFSRNVQHSWLIGNFKTSLKRYQSSLLKFSCCQQGNRHPNDAPEITKFINKSGSLGVWFTVISSIIPSKPKQLALNDCIAFSNGLLTLCPNDIGGQISSRRRHPPLGRWPGRGLWMNGINHGRSNCQLISNCIEGGKYMEKPGSVAKSWQYFLSFFRDLGVCHAKQGLLKAAVHLPSLKFWKKTTALD